MKHFVSKPTVVVFKCLYLAKLNKKGVVGVTCTDCVELRTPEQTVVLPKLRYHVGSHDERYN